MGNELHLFLKRLKLSGLPVQAKKTLRGQALSGDLTGAQKGFYRLLEARQKSRKEVG